MTTRFKRAVRTGMTVAVGLSLSGAALAATVEAASQALTITPNGKTVMTHGELSAVSGNTLTVKHHGLSWTVNVADTTRIVRRFWGKSTLAEFQVGDLLNVQGTLVEGQLAVNATLIRDASIREGDVTGKVDSVTAPDTFVVARADGSKRTVKVASDTVITDMTGATKTFADIVVGAHVRVSGVYNRLSEVLTSRKVVIRKVPVVTPAPAPVPTDTTGTTTTQ